MAKLLYSTAALTDLIDIAAYLAQAASRAVANEYTGRLRAKCKELAALPFPVGRARPELGSELRSYAFGNYMLFFRCADQILYIIAVIEGHRDVSTFFSSRSESR